MNEIMFLCPVLFWSNIDTIAESDRISGAVAEFEDDLKLNKIVKQLLKLLLISTFGKQLLKLLLLSRYDKQALKLLLLSRFTNKNLNRF